MYLYHGVECHITLTLVMYDAIVIQIEKYSFTHASKTQPTTEIVDILLFTKLCTSTKKLGNIHFEIFITFWTSKIP